MNRPFKFATLRVGLAGERRLRETCAMPSPRPILAALVLALAVAALPALAATKSKAPAKPKVDPYTACMEKARTAPDEALKQAQALWKAGAKTPSRHCVATALLSMGRSAQAAKVLDDLVHDLKDAPKDQVAELSAQAARAWLDAGNAAKAEAAFGRAIAFSPKDAGLLVERAIARGAAGRDWNALDDLNRAVELAPKDALARVLRGAAYRRVGAPDLALENLQAALRLAPNDADAWLELGLLHQSQGRKTEAEQAFNRAIALDPRGAAGRTAAAARARLLGTSH